MSATQVITELVIDSRPAEAGAARFEAAMEKAAKAQETGADKADAAMRKAQAAIQAQASAFVGSSQKLAAANDQAAISMVRRGESVAGLTRSLQRLEAASDPLYAATLKIEGAQNKLDAAVRKGIIGQDEAARRLDVYRQRMDVAATSADRLLKSYDATYANASAYREVEADVQRLVAARNLTVEQGNTILLGASARYKQVGDDAKGANDNVKLTSNQMQGLGYQVNDIGTMLAMGSSPFQIMASQAGQVVQVLQDGPNGIKGSLAAIGSSIAGFARSIPTAGYAVAGLTAGVAALWYMTKGPEARGAEESLKTFEGAIKRLEANWKSAAEAARQHYADAARAGDSRPAAVVDVYRDTATLQKDLRASIRELNDDDTLSEKIIRPFISRVSDARQEITDLYVDVRRGGSTVQQLADKLLTIRLNPQADASARSFADEILAILPPLVEVERKAQALNNTLAQMRAPKGTMARNALPDEVFADRFGPAIGSNNRFGDGAALETIRQGLVDQTEALTETEKATNAYTDAVAAQKAGIAASISELRLQVDMFGQSEGSIAAARFKMDALAEAQRQATEAKKDAIDPELVKDIDRQAAEYGRLTNELAASTEAQKERTRAEQEATRERERSIQQMERQRERIAEFEADLIFERSISGLPEAEQKVRETLHRLDVDYASSDGQRLAGMIRYNDKLAESRERMIDYGDVAKDVFGNMLDALGQGGSLVDNLAGAFAGLGKQLATAGLDRLVGGLFGGTTANKPTGLGAILSGLATNQNTAPPVPTTVPTLAPTPAMQQASVKLAEGVTTSVSDTLLRNMLASGKSQSHVTGLNREFATALTNMFSAAPAAVQSAVTIYSGFRSVERQAELFADAVKKYGSETAARRMVAPPGRSQHNFGNAVDLNYGGSAAARNWVHQNAGQYGLRFPMSWENWHLELASARGGNRDGARTIQKATASGVTDALDRWSGLREGNVVQPIAAATPQLTPAQAGIGAMGSLFGIAANGYQSGSPIMGGISGALGGFEMAGALGSALGLGAMATPIGMGIGAAVGLISAPAGKRKSATRSDKQRRYAEFQATKGKADDGNQYLLAA